MTKAICLIGLFLSLFVSNKKPESILLKSEIVTLKHDMLIEDYFAYLGIVDITKLSETLKKEIEEMQIVRVAEFPSDDFSAQIVLIDANQNGIIEYDSIDMIGLASFTDGFEIMKVNFTKSNKPIVAKIGNNLYEIKLLEDGSELELIAREKEAYDITFPYLLPDVKYPKLTKDAKLNKSNGKYTYVEFWGTWCKPCLAIVPEIKALKEQFEDDLNIVGVNHKDRDLDRVKRCILEKEMNWDHVISTEELMLEFGNPGFWPFGILFDSNGRLIGFGIEPNRVEAELLKAINN